MTGEPGFPVDHDLEERPRRTAWAGVDIINHHRPLKRYMQALPGHGLLLSHFDEPPATGGPVAKRDRYKRVPSFHILLWRRP